MKENDEAIPWFHPSSKASVANQQQQQGVAYGIADDIPRGRGESPGSDNSGQGATSLSCQNLY